MIIRYRFLTLLIAFGIAFAPLQARTEQSGQTELYLVMSMAGVTAGSLRLTIDPADGGIASTLKMKSQGLFKLLTGYKSRSEAVSRPASNGIEPKPVSFDSTYETKKSERKVLIRYDSTSGRITDLGNWKRGKPRKSKVPEELRLNTVDPLTAVLQLRHWIRNIAHGTSADGLVEIAGSVSAKTLEIFDGRRRYRLTAELMDHLQIDFDDDRRSAWRFKVRMEPLAGFNKRDMLANWASGDGKRWIELIVTDDDDPIPVSLKTHGGALETSVYLRKVCKGESGCKKVDS